MMVTIGRGPWRSLFRGLKAKFRQAGVRNRKGSVANVSKPKLDWDEKGEDEDFDAAERYLSLLCSDAKAAGLVKSLRNAKLVDTRRRICCAPRTSRCCRVTNRTSARI